MLRGKWRRAALGSILVASASCVAADERPIDIAKAQWFEVFALERQADRLVMAGRFREAEPAYRKVVELHVKHLGEADIQTADRYIDLADTVDRLGRPAEAESYYRRALAVATAAKPDDSTILPKYLSALAFDLMSQGGYREAEPLLRRSVQIARTDKATPGSRLAVELYNLADNLDGQGRLAEAEKFYREAVALWRSPPKPDVQLYNGLTNLAFNLDAQGQRDEAEQLFGEALSITTRMFGEDDDEVARCLNNLGGHYMRVGRHADAESLFRKSLEIRLSHKAETNPALGPNYSNMAWVLESRDRPKEAEAMLRKNVAAMMSAFGRAHPDTAAAYQALSENLVRQGKTAAALEAADLALDSGRRSTRQSGRWDEAAAARGKNASQDGAREIFAKYMDLAWVLHGRSPELRQALAASAFRTSQDLLSSGTAQVMSQAISRIASGDGELARSIREQQDLRSQLQSIQERLLGAYGSDDAAPPAALRKEQDLVEAKLAATEQRIRTRFPAYAELVEPQPLELEDAQKLLAADEGLLVIVAAGDHFSSFAVTPKTSAYHRSDFSVKQVVKDVADLRCDLDKETCSLAREAELNAIPLTASEQEQIGSRFDLFASYRLYADLVAPVVAALRGAKRLYVVRSPQLASLPFSALVTREPAPGTDIASPDIIQNANWFGDDFALTDLPAVAALRLRTIPVRTKGAPLPFLGYGAPSLAPAASSWGRGAPLFFGYRADGLKLADPASIRKMPSLPGTQAELSAMATIFGNAPEDIVTGAAATEAAFRADPRLANANVIALSTHGVLPAANDPLGEPGLIFTPPQSATLGDDGLLSASEASALTLRADWVILSACNTATEAGVRATDGLSALSKAFLYAGARSLLASHWRVSDAATAALIVETLATRKSNPGLTRAQALQLAMRSVRTGHRPDGSQVKGWENWWSHPSAWAAFSIVANVDQ